MPRLPCQTWRPNREGTISPPLRLVCATEGRDIQPLCCLEILMSLKSSLIWGCPSVSYLTNNFPLLSTPGLSSLKTLIFPALPKRVPSLFSPAVSSPASGSKNKDCGRKQDRFPCPLPSHLLCPSAPHPPPPTRELPALESSSHLAHFPLHS